MKRLSLKEMKAVKGGEMCPFIGGCAAFANGVGPGGGISYCLYFWGCEGGGSGSGSGSGYSGGGGSGCTYSPPYVPPGGSPGPGY